MPRIGGKMANVAAGSIHNEGLELSHWWKLNCLGEQSEGEGEGVREEATPLASDLRVASLNEFIQTKPQTWWERTAGASLTPERNSEGAHLFYGRKPSTEVANTYRETLQKKPELKEEMMLEARSPAKSSSPGLPPGRRSSSTFVLPQLGRPY